MEWLDDLQAELGGFSPAIKEEGENGGDYAGGEWNENDENSDQENEGSYDTEEDDGFSYQSQQTNNNNKPIPPTPHYMNQNTMMIQTSPAVAMMRKKNMELKRQIKAMKLRMINDEVEEETESLHLTMSSVLTMLEEREKRDLSETLRQMKNQNDKVLDSFARLFSGGGRGGDNLSNGFLNNSGRGGGSERDDGSKEDRLKDSNSSKTAGKAKSNTSNSSSSDKISTSNNKQSNASSSKGKDSNKQDVEEKEKGGNEGREERLKRSDSNVDATNLGKEKKPANKNELKTGNEFIDNFFRERETTIQEEEANNFDAEEEKEEKERQEEELKKKKEIEKRKKMADLSRNSFARPLWRLHLDGINDPTEDMILKGKSLFRASSLAVIFPHSLIRQYEKNALIKKAVAQAAMAGELKDFLGLFKLWLAKGLRTSVTSIGLQPTLDLSMVVVKEAFSFFKTTNAKDNDLHSRALKIKVRIKGILDDLNKLLDTEVPNQIFEFVAKIIKDGTYFPDKWFYKDEQDILKFSKFGALIDMTLQPLYPQVIIISFIFLRIIIPYILLTPWDVGLGKQQPKIEVNCKCVATVLYRIVRLVIPGMESGFTSVTMIDTNNIDKKDDKGKKDDKEKKEDGKGKKEEDTKSKNEEKGKKEEVNKESSKQLNVNNNENPSTLKGDDEELNSKEGKEKKERDENKTKDEEYVSGLLFKPDYFKEVEADFINEDWISKQKVRLVEWTDKLIVKSLEFVKKEKEKDKKKK